MASSHDNLGSLLGQTGSHEAATTCFKNAVALDPQNCFYRYNLAVNLFARKVYLESNAQFQLALMFAGKRIEVGKSIIIGLSQTFFKIFM